MNQEKCSYLYLIGKSLSLEELKVLTEKVAIVLPKNFNLVINALKLVFGEILKTTVNKHKLKNTKHFCNENIEFFYSKLYEAFAAIDTSDVSQNYVTFFGEYDNIRLYEIDNCVYLSDEDNNKKFILLRKEGFMKNEKFLIPDQNPTTIEGRNICSSYAVASSELLSESVYTELIKTFKTTNEVFGNHAVAISSLAIKIDQQSALLEQQSAMLNQQSDLLKQQSDLLKQQSAMLKQQSEEIEKLKN